jgi:hypothetical protein
MGTILEFKRLRKTPNGSRVGIKGLYFKMPPAHKAQRFRDLVRTGLPLSLVRQLCNRDGP